MLSSIVFIAGTGKWFILQVNTFSKKYVDGCVKNSDLVMWKVKWNEFVSEFVLNYIGTNKESKIQRTVVTI